MIAAFVPGMRSRAGASLAPAPAAAVPVAGPAAPLLLLAGGGAVVATAGVWLARGGVLRFPAMRRDGVNLVAERGPVREPRKPVARRQRAGRAGGDPLTDFLGSRQGRQIQREVIRGVFGMLRKRL